MDGLISEALRSRVAQLTANPVRLYDNEDAALDLRAANELDTQRLIGFRRRGWQPMEAAPVGERIIVLKKTGEIYGVYWDGPNPWFDVVGWIPLPA
jgi:hypothetical protein